MKGIHETAEELGVTAIYMRGAQNVPLCIQKREMLHVFMTTVLHALFRKFKKFKCMIKKMKHFLPVTFLNGNKNPFFSPPRAKVKICFALCAAVVIFGIFFSHCAIR